MVRFAVILRWLHENNHFRENTWLPVTAATEFILRSARSLTVEDRDLLMAPYEGGDIPKSTAQRDLAFWRDLCFDHKPEFGYRLPRHELGCITALRGIGILQKPDGTMTLALSVSSSLIHFS